MTGKVTVGSDGRVTGPAQIVHNDPFPCVNGRFGSGSMMGVLMHTTVSEAPSAIAWFNNPQAQASAQFVIAESGEITQMGPIGKGWEAWHAAEANATWYGIEHADNGNPANPLTQAQIAASAQLVECLSAFAGFPLQISNSPSVKGYGWHGMGGEAFGGHPDCPGEVRKAQRPQIIALAMAIRSGAAPPSPVPAWQEAIMNALPTLSPGAADKPGEVSFVHRMQALVRVIGEIAGLAEAAAVVTNGTFDAATKAGVEQIQAAKKLTVDSIVGPATWSVLVTGSAP